MQSSRQRTRPPSADPDWKRRQDELVAVVNGCRVAVWKATEHQGWQAAFEGQVIMQGHARRSWSSMLEAQAYVVALATGGDA